MRILTSNGVYVKLWTAMCRVTPMRERKIPRLELLACLLLSKLLRSLVSAVEGRFVIDRLTCWTDSQIALWWIKKVRKEWKVWVENRVTKIRELVAPRHWKYVRTNSNPADIATRKSWPTSLAKNSLWWNGPSFLKQDANDWPVVDVDLVEPLGGSEEEKTVVSNALTVDVLEGGGVGTVIERKKFSNLNKLLRVTAYVMRFVNNLKMSLNGKVGMRKGDLDVEEIDECERLWCKYEQSFVVGSAQCEKMKISLRLYRGDDDLLRSRTRINDVKDIDFNKRNPLLLRKDSHYSKLVVIRAHSQVCHNGVDCTLNHVRTRYWIIRDRQFVKSILKRCFVCRLVQGKPVVPPERGKVPD